MTDAKPMRCALCNTPHPWEPAFWPDRIYAVCWRCHVKEIVEDLRSAQRKAQYLGTCLFAAVLAILVLLVALARN